MRRKMAAFKKKNPHYYQDYQLRRKYGITLTQYETLVEMQEGCCAICGDSALTLVVDHDADTGKVRGLLCNPCNMGIGQLKHSVVYLLRAASYLAEEDYCE